jgi:prephenate dehydrogenase
MTTIGIVGLGLIGGSIALRAKAADPKTTVIGMSRRVETTEFAHQHGIIDRIATHYSEFDGADIVFVCTPIPQVLETLLSLDQAITQPTILTDVASLKLSLSKAVAQRSWRHSVILGHPMAGKETTGIDSADPELLIDKTYILIDHRQSVLSQALMMWGCRVVMMDAAQHDQMVGYASHLPYLAAILAAGIAQYQCNELALFAKIAASGFRDTTRVAGSDPAWGADVLIGNGAVVQEGIGAARQLLDEVERLVAAEDRDGLIRVLSGIREFRNNVVAPL